jgi:hypothetical protein
MQSRISRALLFLSPLLALAVVSLVARYIRAVFMVKLTVYALILVPAAILYAVAEKKGRDS